MNKKIYIVLNSTGWTVLSGKGEKLSQGYPAVNRALEMARMFAKILGAEIVIFTHPHQQVRREKSRGFQRTEKKIFG